MLLAFYKFSVCGTVVWRIPLAWTRVCEFILWAGRGRGVEFRDESKRFGVWDQHFGRGGKVEGWLSVLKSENLYHRNFAAVKVFSECWWVQHVCMVAIMSDSCLINQSINLWTIATDGKLRAWSHRGTFTETSSKGVSTSCRKKTQTVGFAITFNSRHVWYRELCYGLEPSSRSLPLMLYINKWWGLTLLVNEQCMWLHWTLVDQVADTQHAHIKFSRLSSRSALHGVTVTSHARGPWYHNQLCDMDSGGMVQGSVVCEKKIGMGYRVKL